MDANGHIFASKSHSVGVFHHSSFLQGKPVSAAGEIEVQNGEILLVTNNSGHYRPNKNVSEQFILELKVRGVNTNNIKFDFY